MKFPACKNQLREKGAGGMTLDVCYGGCGGIWFDTKELGRVSARAATTLHTVWQVPVTNVKLTEPRLCPRCDQQVLERKWFSDAKQVESGRFVRGILQLILLGVLLTVLANSQAAEEKPIRQSLKILASWSGDYPVAALNQLPKGQQTNQAGYIGDPQTFRSVLEKFDSTEKAPQVDFQTNLVVFARNVIFYNPVRIGGVTLFGSEAELLTMEARSARPIEDKVRMALAVIPRQGVLSVRSGNQSVKVTPSAPQDHPETRPK